MMQVVGRVRPLGDLIFRANPAYELLVYDRLAEDERAALQSFAEDGDFYGVLRPRGPRMTVKAVSHDAALLFLTLSAAGTVPSSLRGRMRPNADEALARLVLDGVLEIGHEDRFISGIEARELLFPEKTRPALTRLAALSRDAIRYGIALQLTDPAVLAARIYFFNRAPVSPSRRARFNSVAEYLGMDRDPVAAFLRRHWSPATPAPGTEGWLVWTSRTERAASRLPFKLYISARYEDLPRTFRVVAETLARGRIPHFKVGADLFGLLRPDNLIVYLPTLDELREVAERLIPELANVPPQGVPFTSEIAGDGLLSWGMDPPPLARVATLENDGSWRIWIANRIASAIVTCQSTTTTSSAVEQFVLDRIRAEGIDTDTWTPDATIWLPEREVTV